MTPLLRAARKRKEGDGLGGGDGDARIERGREDEPRKGFEEFGTAGGEGRGGGGRVGGEGGVEGEDGRHSSSEGGRSVCAEAKLLKQRARRRILAPSPKPEELEEERQTGIDEVFECLSVGVAAGLAEEYDGVGSLSKGSEERCKLGDGGGRMGKEGGDNDVGGLSGGDGRGRELDLLENEAVDSDTTPRQFVLLRQTREPPSSKHRPHFVLYPAESSAENTLLHTPVLGGSRAGSNLLFEDEGVNEGKEGEGDGVLAGKLLRREDIG
jgi:hypothetical protein